MITALVLANGPPVLLSRTLASLVPGAVEGLVREVVVIGDAEGDIGKVANHAGCAIVGSGGTADAIGRARGEWLLLVEAGIQFLPGWVDGVSDHIAEASPSAAAARFRLVRTGRFSLLGALRREAPLGVGVLMRRVPVASGTDIAALARSARARRVLNAEVRRSAV